MANNNNRQQGFTLIEMMVAIVIVVILAAMAVPPYQDFIKRNTVESLQSRFAAAVVNARTEAAARNTITTLCASSDGATCMTTNKSWSSGWIVFADANTIGVVDGAAPNADQVLLSYQPSSKYKVNFQNEAAAAIYNISFTNQGFVRGDTRGYATLCDPDSAKKYARGLTIERSGRVMKSRDSDNNGYHDFKFDKGDGTIPAATELNCTF